MSNQSKQWFSVTIQVVSEHQELLANRCFELGSNGITFTDTAITAYFSTRTNPESVIQELHTYCGSLCLLGIVLDTSHITASAVARQDGAENWKAFFTPAVIQTHQTGK